LKLGLIGYPKTSVWNNHSMLHNISEEHRLLKIWQHRPWFGSA